MATAKKLTIYSFAHGGILRPIQSIDTPTSDDGPVAFRAVRFAPGSPARPSILAALNSTTLPRREARKKTRKAYIVKFDPAPIEEVQEGEKEGSEKQQVLDEKIEPESPPLSWSIANKREVASKPITVMDVSKDGRLVSFGCSDLSIGMLDAHTLAPLLKILRAHSFPPTALKFNPSATMLVSASADNTIRTVIVPSSFGASGEFHQPAHSSHQFRRRLLCSFLPSWYLCSLSCFASRQRVVVIDRFSSSGQSRCGGRSM